MTRMLRQIWITQWLPFREESSTVQDGCCTLYAREEELYGGWGSGCGSRCRWRRGSWTMVGFVTLSNMGWSDLDGRGPVMNQWRRRRYAQSVAPLHCVACMHVYSGREDSTEVSTKEQRPLTDNVFLFLFWITTDSFGSTSWVEPIIDILLVWRSLTVHYLVPFRSTIAQISCLPLSQWIRTSPKSPTKTMLDV